MGPRPRRARGARAPALRGTVLVDAMVALFLLALWGGALLVAGRSFVSRARVNDRVLVESLTYLSEW